MKGALVVALCAVFAAAASSAAAQKTTAAPTGAGLTLDEAVRRALARDERTLAADQRSSAAAARVRRARAFFFPDITLVGSYTRRAHDTLTQSQDALSASATANLSIFDARATPLYRSAKIEREAVELAARDTRRIVAFETADAFLQTLANEQVEAATLRRVTFANQRLAEARARVDAQLASSNDATRAELELASAERDHTRALNAARLSRLSLAHLIGDSGELGALVPPAMLLDRATIEAANQRAEATQRQRYDIRSQFRTADALREFAKEPARRFVPSLGVSGQYRITSDDNLPRENTDWNVSLNLTWNLWDGGERAAEESEREANAMAAQLQAEALLRRAGFEYRSAVATVEASETAVRQAQAAVEIASRNASEVSELYRQGLATALVVADAGLRLFDAEVDLARERYALGLAHLDVRASLGQEPSSTAGAIGGAK